jgi:hypothetical protein
MRTDKLLKHGWHWSFGWLRRPEYDLDYWYCYEHPDGELWMAKLPALYLDCRMDSKTGEIYTCRSPIPRKPMNYDPSTKSAHPSRNAKG